MRRQKRKLSSERFQAGEEFSSPVLVLSMEEGDWKQRYRKPLATETNVWPTANTVIEC